jgi:hypothetical protein
MLSAELESQVHKAKKLVAEAEADDDDEAKSEAVEKVMSLKETLKQLKDQVVDEAESNKHSK